MRLIHQFAQLSERPEVFLNLVKVLRVVPMKTRAGLSVLKFDLIRMIVVVIPRRKPEGGHAKVFQIGEAIDDALQISAMAIELVSAICETFQFRPTVVCLI